MIHFDASEIANWADQPAAPHLLPDLIRRLILATAPRVSLLDIPSGSSVFLPGWDGLLVTNGGNLWVPDGYSAWEFGCDQQVRRKANAEYSKRTETPVDVERSTATFVFASPRKWSEKRKWLLEKANEGHWSDVRAVNASDLVAWLQQAPAVAHWFARLIGKLPEHGVVPLDEWWEHWATAANPEISYDLVAAGRQEQMLWLAEWFQDAPSSYYVQADTQEEAVAFLAASAVAEATLWGSALLARAIVVQNADAWRGLEKHPFPLALIRAFSDPNISSRVAVNAGHHVLIPLGKTDDPRGYGLTLPRLGRYETKTALVAMGLTEQKARLLCRNTARRLPAIRRQLVDEAGGAGPGWASSGTPHSTVTLVLIGQWDSNSEGDKAIVSEITGQYYEEIERDIADLVASEALLVQVGTRYSFVSHEEAWHLLASRLTASEIARFEEVASRVLGELSPEFDLPPAERYMAEAKGKVLNQSRTLRAGIARTLALMRTNPERSRNPISTSRTPAQVLYTVFEKNKEWRIWATLEQDLATLAEAAPEILLDAIEDHLAMSPSPISDLFEEEGDGLTSGAPHTGVLWALERLAWWEAYFTRVARILAALAELDPGGRMSNRPAESLRSLFLPWTRFSEVSDQHRLETLGLLLQCTPEAGWNLLVQTCPSSADHVTGREAPFWRPLAQDSPAQPTWEEYFAFLDELTQLLIHHVGTDPGRWADLVGILSDFPEEARREAIQSLGQRVDALREHTDLDKFWHSLRRELYRHRGFPDAEWAMHNEDLNALEAVYRSLVPVEPVARYAWIFDDWPALPGTDPRDYLAAFRSKEEAQQCAVREASVNHGIEVIATIAEAANDPAAVGLAVARGLESDIALELALDNLQSSQPKLKSLVQGILRGLFLVSGWQPLEEAFELLNQRDTTVEEIAWVYLAAPPSQEVWDRLGVENGDVASVYWKSIDKPNIAGWKPNEIAFAAQQLIAVNRALSAVNWLAYTSVDDETISLILEAVPQNMRKGEGKPAYHPNFTYHIAHLFEKLDQSETVADEEIAGLEIPYLSTLRYIRPNMAFDRQVCREPSLFVDLVCYASGYADGQQDEALDGQTRRVMGSFAIRALWHLRGFPGKVEDGSVDAEALSLWVHETRRLCKERGRVTIGDRRIGQVLANCPEGEDSIWPCEPVRDLLETLSIKEVGNGFVSGKRNLRGTTARRIFDGGAQERSLAEIYRQDAVNIAFKWPFTARLLHLLADSYTAQGQVEDERASLVRSVRVLTANPIVPLSSAISIAILQALVNQSYFH